MSVRTTAVDAVGLEERAASLSKRSIKRDAKLWALDLAIRSMDLTTLEGSDTVGKIVAICAKAVRPDPLDPTIPPVAAVCLYPQLVPVALEHLDGTGVKVASVAGGFPSGLGPLDARLQEIRDVAEAGAHEIDIVLNRPLPRRQLRAGLRRARGRPRGRRLGPPEGDPRDRRARVLRPRAAGEHAGDGRGRGLHQDVHGQDRRERHVARCPLHDGGGEDFHRDTGRAVGIKVAGGVRTAKQAIQNLVLLHETLGSTWMTPDRSDRRVLVAERRPDADREGTHRPLRGPGLFHDRLTLVVVQTMAGRILSTAHGTHRGSFAAVDWLLFAAVGTIWGSSFLFMAIGLEAFQPGLVTWLRVLFGAALLWHCPGSGHGSSAPTSSRS